MKSKLSIFLAVVLLVLGGLACGSSASGSPTAANGPVATGTPPALTGPSATVPSPAAQPSPTPAPVPAESQALYAQLQQSLQSADGLLGTPDPQPGLVFSTDLLTANSNRGTDLLQPGVLDATRLFLDRLAELGIRGVKISVHYPLLVSGFAHSQDYVQFYGLVAQLVRAHGMTLTVQMNVIFAGTPFSNVQVDFSNLTFTQFEQENRAMAQTIIDSMHPDYLVLLSEPDTAAALTGLRELNDPQHVLEYVQYVLDGLQPGSTRVGAGSGSWSSLDFTRLLAEQTRLDFISIHVYPIQSQFVQNALAMAELAHANHKDVVISEAWLYKTASPGVVQAVANSVDASRQDTFSFWEPLDEQFLGMMTRLADRTGARVVSFFWSTRFFGYAAYTPALATATFPQASQAANAVANSALQADAFSPLGLSLRDLIARH